MGTSELIQYGIQVFKPKITIEIYTFYPEMYPKWQLDNYFRQEHLWL